MPDTPESFDLSPFIRDVTFTPEPLESFEDAWEHIPGLKAVGPITIRGYWLGPHDHVESDRRKARRMVRRYGVKFTTRKAFKHRTYWFDYSERR